MGLSLSQKQDYPVPVLIAYLHEALMTTNDMELHLLEIFNKNKTKEGILKCEPGKQYKLKLTGFSPSAAVILYPALLTPLILNGKSPQKVELLIAGKSGETLTAEHVNNQLKICDGIHPDKAVSKDSLFDPADINSHIVVTPITSDINDVISTESRIKGYLDSRFVKILTDAGFSKLYSITLLDFTFNSSGISSEVFNCVWADTVDISNGASQEAKIEQHDRIIKNVLESSNGKGIQNGGKLSFKIEKDDINYSAIDDTRPVQSYHPIILFPDDKHLNIGLVGDPHCSARQNVLAKSRARVIDYDSTETTYTPPGSTSKDPTATKNKIGSATVVTPVPPQPQPATGTYTVAKGDWLEKIAKNYNMTWKELWNYYGDSDKPNSKRLRSGDPNKIYPGEVIVVPVNSQPIVPPASDKQIDVSHNVLTYTMYEKGKDPPALEIDVASVNSSDLLEFSVQPQDTWISIDPSMLFGTTAKTIKIEIKSLGLTPGNYSSTIEIVCSDAINSPLIINVSLTIYAEVPNLEDSPEIGPLFNIASRSFKTILDKFGADNDIDVVAIAGDIIDYIKNCYDDGKTALTAPYQIWNQVEMTDNGEGPHYQEHVDYIGCYSLFVDFYIRYRKPLFIIAGNHDPYQRPWAASPRVSFANIRANAGIPADSNLTFYENILIFGESYHRHPGFSKNLVPECYKWFFTVLTPFSDFIVDFSKQTLLGLSWGDGEDIQDAFAASGQEDLFAWGHLPRATESFSDKQIKLFEMAASGKKKKILLSHFTFVSYFENIPMNTGISKQGEVKYKEIALKWWEWFNPLEWFDSYKRENRYMMGTFEKNRAKIYKDHLTKLEDIDLILTGHMHRRGCYQITGINESDDYVTTTFYDNTDFTKLKHKTSPAIIVCDSGGNLPRFNLKGEFGGWGSDRASGSKITFDASGNINEVITVPVGPKPRIAVALDYYDIVCNIDVIAKFECDKFKEDDERADGVDYAFSLEMPKEIAELIKIDKIVLYRFATDKTWKQVSMEYNTSLGRWVIKRGQPASTFRTFFVPVSTDSAEADMEQANDRSRFMSMRFSQKSPDIAQYDFSSAWNFEFRIERDYSGIFTSKLSYKLKRKVTDTSKDVTPFAEIPDFNWRKKLKKYRRSVLSSKS